jgi:very-short-patch-repair endonuclease
MKNHVRLARKLRRNQTPAEKVFWELVRNRKFQGRRFLRQHLFWFEIEGKKRFFIADFYCASANLVIELDGSIHDTQLEYDFYRTRILEQKGLKVVRFTNLQIIKEPELVLNKLKINLKKS